MSNTKRISKAIKQLNKIETKSQTIKDVIKALEAELSFSDNTAKDNEGTLIDIFHSNASFKEKRDYLTNVLEKGYDVSFDYEKKDGSVRVVNVQWNDDYTYDIPPEDSDFIFLYDVDDDYFKHFKLNKMENFVVSES